MHSEVGIEVHSYAEATVMWAQANQRRKTKSAVIHERTLGEDSAATKYTRTFVKTIKTTSVNVFSFHV